jgi:hypothetical protein
MDVTNVGAGKPKLTGSVFRAPVGTTLPTNATDALDEAFKNLGFSADDGLTNGNSPESEDIKAWGGTVVMSLTTEKPDTYTIKLIESTNPDVLKAVYGDDNVEVDETSGDITVKANAADAEDASWVFDMILRNKYKRVVLPDAKISEIGDIVYKDDEVVGYEITLTALPDASNNTHYEYYHTITA